MIIDPNYPTFETKRYTPDRTHLKHRIAEKRNGLGLTQQQLADQLGWSLRKLTSYERFERIPPLTEALELAKALKSTVEEIWTLEKGD